MAKNFLALIENWIMTEVKANATLTGIIGEQVWLGSAPAGKAENQYIVFNHVRNNPQYNLGTKRDFSWAEYDITINERGQFTEALETGADEISDAFGEFRGRQFNGYNFNSRLVAEISLSGSEQDGLGWRKLGGTFRISASLV